MLDVIKISMKVAAISAAVAALAVVLLLIRLPAVDFSVLSTYIGHVYAFAVHWCPIIANLWNLALTVIGINLALLTFRAGLFLFKIIMSVFE